MQSAPQIVLSTTVKFETKTYDVTNTWAFLCLFPCGPYKSLYIMEPEFLVQEDYTICATNRIRKPYAEANVDKSTACCCCVSINGLSPGLGCQTQKVDEIAHELQVRIGARGATAQVQKAEKMAEDMVFLLNKVNAMDAKLDLLVQKMHR